MKKFLVGLMSVFLLIGGGLLSACAGNKGGFELSTQSVEIELIGNENRTGQAVVTVKVFGGAENEIKTSYDSSLIQNVEVKKISADESLLTIKARTETENAKVTVWTGNCESQTIDVVAFSYASSMEQKQEDGDKKKNYLVKGETITLVDENLISFSPSEKSRRDIKWELVEGDNNVTISGNQITVGNGFNDNEIQLRATNLLKSQTNEGDNASCEITLPVLDKISTDSIGGVVLQAGYTSMSNVDDGQTFDIVSNNSKAPNYELNAQVTYSGNLKVSATVTSTDGKLDADELKVMPNGKSEEGYQKFLIYTNKDHAELNGQFDVEFEIGYEGYDYSVKLSDKLHVKVRTTISSAELTDREGARITDETIKSVYTNYASGRYGEMIKVELAPTTVVDANYTFTVRAELPESSLSKFVNYDESNFSPLIVKYKNSENVMQEEIMIKVNDGCYEASGLPKGIIYLVSAPLASGNEKVDGVKITVTSDDEPSANSSFNAQLIRAVNELEDAIKVCDISGNELNDSDFAFVLNSSRSGNSVKKYFKLIGQGSVDGLHVKSNSAYVNIEDKLIIKSRGTTESGSPYVIFEITATLSSTANGVTALGSYEFYHDNGAQTGENFKEKLKLDIFLPLTDASIRYDESNNSNSVVDKTYGKNDFVGNDYSSSITNLILKNNTMTPISVAFNRSSNEIEASPSVRVGFIDLDDDLSALTMDELLARLDGDEAKLIPTVDSNILTISYTSNDAKSIQNIYTKNVGKTYVIFTFIGKDERGGEVSIRRIVKVESLISVDQLMFENSKDKNISLYAGDTIADEDISQTKRTIKIYFANSGITYADINENFVFDSVEDWKDYFKIENKRIGENKDYIEFTITALSTKNNAIFNKTIELHYVVKNGDKEIINRPISFELSIYNAQRIEKVVWKNEREDGLEFNVGEKSGQILMFEVTPTNAKNSNLNYLSIDNSGNVLGENGVVKVSQVSSDKMAVTISSLTKMKGSIFVYPSDMVHNRKIRFYSDEFIDGEEVALDNLGKLKGEGETWFEYLTKNAYFISYKQDENGIFNREEIPFANIIKKIDIIVVDGSSFEYSYKLYSVEDFNSIETDKYYTLKNNVTIKFLYPIENFSGGFQGDNTSITFESGSKNAIKNLTGHIRNITLIGSVVGSGFVCDINNGTIENVTIETNGTYASKLISEDAYAGGIAGINNGQIKSSSVLGLSISGNSTTIGGIAGRNNGSIYEGKVEFYKTQTGEGAYATNNFAGKENATIAGLVGEASKGSTVKRSYAYDYTLSSETITSGVNAPFIGKVDKETEGANPYVEYSFAVVGIKVVGDSLDEKISNAFPAGVDYKDVYNSFYNDGIYETVVKETDTNSFLKSGQNGFLNYVNGGEAHLKDLYQDEKTTNVSIAPEDISTNLGYKQVMVTEEQIIFMHYSLADMKGSLTQTEQNDLDNLNTISIDALVGKSKNIKVSSSNSRIVKVVGSGLVVNQTGEVTLTFSSRQDASIKQEKKIIVVSAFNGFNLSYGNTQDVNSKTIRIQKTKTASFTAMLTKTDVYLGNLATKYQLVIPKVDFESEILTTDDNSVEITKTGDVFIAVTTQYSVQTKVKVISKINDVDYTHTSTLKEFIISPEEGAISISYTGEKLSISPSTNHEITVNVKTTKSMDDIIPYISYNADEKEIILTRAGENGKYVFSRGEQEVLEVTIVKEQNGDISSDLYNDKYSVTFAVHENYKTKVSDEEEFEVYFATSTKNESEKLTLVIDRQEFTSIDIVNTIITNAYRAGGKDVYVVGEKTSMLAPAHSSIMQVSINPKYAYYDYVEIGYSGISVEGGVDIVLMEKIGDNFTKSSERLDRVGEYLRYTPSNRGKLEQIFFKIWINTTVEIDSTIVLTVRFMKNGEEQPEDKNWANYYIDVSYLKEPRISVDGGDYAFLAKGGECDLKIEVLENQRMDSLVVDGDVSGITISSIEDNGFDPATGIRTYTAKIKATLNAKASVDKKDGIFYLKATVRRTFNGFDETKDALATVILVDFKIDEDNILIGEKSGDNQVLEVWAGVPKTISINYNLDPSEYPSAEANRAEAQDLIQKRNEFLNSGYYPAENVDNANYIINYRKLNENYTQLKISDRLFYVIGGKEYSLNDDAIANKTIKVEGEENNSFTITGNVKSGNSVNMVLYTYITANGIEKKIATYFTVKIETFSDEDLPLVLNDAEDFMALNPDDDTLSTTEGERKAEDYILTNDIVLENYTPFDTKYISSLDGNGYTIYIKSFATPEVGETFKVALFDNVLNGTLLKNIRVNIYEGGQLKVNVSQFKNIQVAGFALQNSGIITNCEVVAFYTDANYQVGSAKINYTSKLPSDKKAGLNLFLTNGENTSNEVFITQNSTFNVSMAGFVIENTSTGSITNSRVGGDDVYILVKEQTNASGQNIGITTAEKVALETFTIVGQGNEAGFVLQNSGTISASFAKNVDLENRSNLSDYYLAGFVGENSGNIVTSYVEGVALDSDKNETARRGSSLKSKGYIAGFVYSNTSTISDSYSNILISSSSSAKDVLYASGFVYKNEGSITNGFSASQIENSKVTQMSFSGLDKNGNLLTNGQYENCYFYQINMDDEESDTTTSTEAQYSTGAMMIADPSVATSFYGFAITTSNNDDSGIWRIVDGQVSLIEPNKISISHRYILYVSEDFEGVSRKDDNGSYILPYATISGNGIKIDTSLGGENNPVIISSAKGFVEAMGESKSTYVKKYFNDNSIYGSYRFVSDIDLSSLTIETASYMLPSTTRAFSGKLYGNGFSINGLLLTSSDKNVVSYGLFKSLEPTIKSSAEFGYNATFNPLITNLTLDVQGVTAGVPMVGSLAGYAKNVTLIGLDVNFADDAKIVGDNLVGGVIGYVFGGSTIKNISVNNPNTYAQYYTSTQNQYVTNNFLDDFRANATLLTNGTTYKHTLVQNYLKKYSYAGSAFGFVDIYRDIADEFDYPLYQKGNYHINNLKVTGTIISKAMVVGGAIGFVGPQTFANDMSVVFDGTSKDSSSSLYSMYGYAGGVIGQSHGGISRIYAQHTEEVQQEIEKNMYNYYNGNTGVERGILNIFVGQEDYTQRAIGGLIGYVGGGILQTSYSKINVVSPDAEYAGGVIGEIQSPEQEYSAEARISTGFKTSYLLHEVYATGDVRGSKKAGGIIGVSKGKNISLLAVNAYNYLSSYDYENEKELNLKEGGETNLSTILKFNVFVGEVYAENSNGELTDKKSGSDIFNNNVKTGVDLSAFKDVITFEQGHSVDESASNLEATISYYQNYQFSNISDFTVNLLDGVSGKDYTLMSDKFTVIEGPHEFTAVSSASSYTQQGFLKSGLWLEDNWKHESDRLFPEIEYRSSSQTLYLDCYNVKQVFEQMRFNNITVIVRGRTAPGADTYADINLNEDKYKSLKAVEGFYGILKGDAKYKVTETGEDIRIVSNRNFINSTNEGFEVKNVIVKYTTNDNSGENLITINNGNGLFVNNTITSAKISGLTIELASGIKFTNVKENSSLGLVAPEIISSDIENISIEALSANGNQLVSTMLSVDNSTISSIGLVAGNLTQDSEIATMTVKNIKVDAKEALMISAKEANVQYVGGLFGKVEKIKENSLSFDFEDISAVTNSAGIEVKVEKEEKDGYIGGAVGYMNGITNVSFSEGGEETSEVASTITIQGDAKNLYVGAIGKIENVASLATPNYANGLKTTIKLGVDEKYPITATTLYAGGFAGQIVGASGTTFNLQNSGASLKIDNANSTLTNAYVGGLVGLNGEDGTSTSASSASITINNVGGGNGVDGTVKVSGNAYVGGLVGKSVADMTVDNKDATAAIKTEGTINITGSQVHFGGIVGDVTNNFTMSATTHGALIEGNANITTNGNLDADLVCAGGVIGYCEGTISINSGATDSTKTYKLICYDGSVKVENEVKEVAFGGIVGKQYQSNTTSTALEFTTSYTSFGGSLTVAGDSTTTNTIYAGGVVGYVTGNGTSSAENTKIDHAYNYGDVFVDNSLTTKNNTKQKQGTDDDGIWVYDVASYYFGGLVGCLSGSGTCTAENNYSLMSSHNSRYSTATKSTAHAMVGVGELTGSNNYYNHKVCLLTDDQATDVGYTQPYSANYRGYNDSTNNTKLASTISDVIKLTTGESFGSGHKLSPASNTTNSAGLIDTNGMIYFTVSQGDYSDDITKSISKPKPEEKTEKAKASSETEYYDIAYIYESNQAIKFTDNTANNYGFINSLSGYSYASGFVIENKRSIESATAYTSTTAYGGLVGSAEINTIVYACQAKGSIEVDGKNVVKVAGLVGSTSGKVFDSSTDIELLYRANSNGYVAGLIGQNKDDTGAFVENCYTGGKITTYISANVYILGETNIKTIGSTLTGETTVYQNCYSYTHLDLNDYVNEIWIGELQLINNGYDLKGSAIYTNVYYDQDATETSFTAYGNKFRLIQGESTTDVAKGKLDSRANEANKAKDKVTDFAKNCPIEWEKDPIYNYGYPTLKYGYLKTSSFAKASTPKAQGTSGYDSYVFDINYENRDNGYKGKASTDNGTTTYEIQSDDFYKIPNATVLNMLNDDENKLAKTITNFTLTNDINLENTSFSNKNLTTSTLSFSGRFDGQGNTISRLKSGLFKEITGKDEAGEDSVERLKNYFTYVINLRLTDVNITSVSNNCAGALAMERINVAFISNMTLSGTINYTGNSPLTLGGLTGIPVWSRIACVTNLIMVTGRSNSNNDSVHVAGIAGQMNSSKLSYCSNYGPINATAAGDYGKDILAGGLVGWSYGESTIEYSYNATSVLSGYAIPGATSLESSNNVYYSAGIVAHARASEEKYAGTDTYVDNLKIDNCYNSGMIKAGNKSQTAGAYAAGIIAKGGSASATTVSNCYNEGSIEALGQTPKGEWTTTNTNSGTTYTDWVNFPSVIAVYKIQNSVNVYAGGVFATNCNNDESYSKSKDDIVLNGTAKSGEIYRKKLAFDVKVLEQPIVNQSYYYGLSKKEIYGHVCWLEGKNVKNAFAGVVIDHPIVNDVSFSITDYKLDNMGIPSGSSVIIEFRQKVYVVLAYQGTGGGHKPFNSAYDAILDVMSDSSENGWEYKSWYGNIQQGSHAERKIVYGNILDVQQEGPSYEYENILEELKGGYYAEKTQSFAEFKSFKSRTESVKIAGSDYSIIKTDSINANTADNYVGSGYFSYSSDLTRAECKTSKANFVYGHSLLTDFTSNEITCVYGWKIFCEDNDIEITSSIQKKFYGVMIFERSIYGKTKEFNINIPNFKNNGILKTMDADIPSIQSSSQYSYIGFDESALDTLSFESAVQKNDYMNGKIKINGYESGISGNVVICGRTYIKAQKGKAGYNSYLEKCEGCGFIDKDNTVMGENSAMVRIVQSLANYENEFKVTYSDIKNRKDNLYNFAEEKQKAAVNYIKTNTFSAPTEFQLLY